MNDLHAPEPSEESRTKAPASIASAVSELGGVMAEAIGPCGTRCLFGSPPSMTADGATIARRHPIAHPAGDLLKQVAQSQARRRGDGVKTALIIAATLVEAGSRWLQDGTNPAQLVRGLNTAASAATDVIRSRARLLQGPNDPVLDHLALTAARGDADIAALVLATARSMHADRFINDDSFSLAEHIRGSDDVSDRMVEGLVVRGNRVSRNMPETVEDAELLLVDDALDIEELPEAMLHAQTGFDRYRELQKQFEENVRKLIHMGVNAALIAGDISAKAAQMLTDAGILAAANLGSEELWRVARLVGLAPIGRRGIQKSLSELRTMVSRHHRIAADPERETLHIEIRDGESTATALVGGITEALADERRLLARTCAASIQAALRDGICPGGGAAALEALPAVEKLRGDATGDTPGISCMAEALNAPAAAIVRNAGYEPEAAVDAATSVGETGAVGIDVTTGEIVDISQLNIYDAAAVTISAIDGAVRLAGTLLRTTRLYE
ncbi:MAG: TCP-1/cpn60 chaperonin family protein [Armatimonadota bacterium]